MQIKKDAKQQHEDLVAFLKDHPELTNSDSSSVCLLISSLFPLLRFFRFLGLYQVLGTGWKKTFV
jgi:hypothetical protein